LKEQDLMISNVEECWTKIKMSIKTNAEEVLGERKNQIRNEWFDDECRQKLEERNKARLKMLQRVTRATRDEYQMKRRVANSTCKRKKREWENEKLTQLQMDFEEHRNRKYYKEVKEIKTGFQPRINFCRDKEGNMLADRTVVLNRWAEYFSNLLNKDIEDGSEGSQRKGVENINGEDIIPEPTLEEVEKEIKMAKNNKAPGMDLVTAEMIKCGGKQLTKSIHLLLCKVWENEVMPEEWSIAIISPIHKKGNLLDCNNYRGIVLMGTRVECLLASLTLQIAPLRALVKGNGNRIKSESRE